ncbi:hypothetical protein C8Q72DRAFT_879143 [Fomitopsis betulina]|nr:hypothetical protein C8Q72DRAFT_879143 [Fomitopsis betulina]
MHPPHLAVSAFPVPPSDNDTSRLPAYRSNYAARFHPYPRRMHRPMEEPMVINFRRDENPVVAQATPLSLIEEVDEDDLLNLESALPAGQQVQRLRRRLSALVIDLAFVVRRRCGALRSPKKLAYPEKLDLLT